MTDEKFKEILNGIRTEIRAGSVLVPTIASEIQWNQATERACNIIDKYIKGEGLFQL